MAAIELNDVGLEYYAYGSSSRSFKRQVLAAATGGLIRTDERILRIQALKGISFKLKAGDRLGLIGHNGSGKTSLLKVLAGIYEPSRGKVEISGRAHGLFDITAGFDFALSGYENIKLRCLMHGLSHRQIQQRMDDIVVFAEIGGFAQMPLKSYSSGMLLRLAFGIVTSLEGDILLVDEVISVGDAGFVEKAKERMKSLIERTGIFVVSTHDHGVIKEFCNIVLHLEHGQIKFFGKAQECEAF